MKRFKGRRRDMFVALFILCLIIFGYLMYVLIKPEKF
ncbi:potassium-transporting ATPase subunit F [Parabacteroides goldsteinii]|nr:potassium-transporting ATPase subunit F [Parabacteroides goldsteinii]